MYVAKYDVQLMSPWLLALAQSSYCMELRYLQYPRIKKNVELVSSLFP